METWIYITLLGIVIEVDEVERTSSLSFRDLPDRMVRMLLAVFLLVTADGGP